MRRPYGIVAILAGALVLAAIAGLKLGAVPPLPTKFLLGVSIPVFYGTFVGAIPQRRRPEAWAPVVGDDPRYRSEEDRLRASQHRRLVALGVAEEDALVLAGHPSFSVDELNRLLGKGCPVDLALRILWPDD